MPEAVTLTRIAVVHRVRHSALRSTARMAELERDFLNEIRRHGELIESVRVQSLGDDGPEHLRIMFSAYVIPHQKKDATQ